MEMLSEGRMKTNMKMNKIGALALLSLVLLSCRNEAPKEAWRKMDYPVLFSLASKEGNMRAAEKGNSPSASLENERSIENLTVVVFTNRRVSNVPLALEKVITNEQLQKPQGGNGKISFEMGLAGIYHLEIIANAYPSGDAVAKQAFLDKLKQGLSHDQFKKVLFDRALPEHGGTGFAMLSADPIKVETKKQQPADAGKIVLHRLACRFDIFNKLPRELSLTKVTLQNQIKASYLITQKDIPSGTGVTTEKSYTRNNDWFTASLVSGGIYSYENPVPGATKLLLEGTYKDKPWQKVIELKNILEQPIATKRNHLYRIYLTKGNGTTPGGTDPADADQVHYGIEVLDWDDDLSLDYTDPDVWNAELINPLKYVAETNINKTSDGFATDPRAIDQSGYFNAITAVAAFANFAVDTNKYHLPSLDEWKSIVPRSDEAVKFDRSWTSSFSEDVIVAGNRVTCKQDFKALGNNVCYALRFKYTRYQSAWKYELTRIPSGSFVMRITARNVGEPLTIEQVANEGFWQQNTSRDIVRQFPASGNNSNGNSTDASYAYGSKGWFRSSTLYSSEGTWFMSFGSGYADSKGATFPSYGLSVRLFKGEGPKFFPQLTVTADKLQFLAQGGSGKVSANLTVYEGSDASGAVWASEKLLSRDYTLALKSGDASQISIDDNRKEFTVRPGNAVLHFTLTATHKYIPGMVQEITVTRMGNPLAYVAESNVNPAGTGFVANVNSVRGSGFFTWPTAVAKFKNITIGGKAYHLPSEKELKSILPMTISFKQAQEVLSENVSVAVAGNSLWCLNDIKGLGKDVSYALRFKRTLYQTAWRYELKTVSGNMQVQVTSRSVPDDVTIANVANETYWQQDKTYDVVRIFPASGRNDGADNSIPTNFLGTSGFYWSTTPFPYSSDSAWQLGFVEQNVYTNSYGKKYGLAVRLFKDTLDR